MSSTQIVHLNVGGIKYDTSYQTITSVPDSMLTALVQRWNEDNDKEIFIDRDGKPFQFILNYLRDRHHVNLPQDQSLLNQISNEAGYYGLTQLVAIVSDKQHKHNRLFKGNGRLKKLFKLDRAQNGM